MNYCTNCENIRINQAEKKEYYCMKCSTRTINHIDGSLIISDNGFSYNKNFNCKYFNKKDGKQC